MGCVYVLIPTSVTVSGPADPCVAKSESVMAEDCICWVLLGRKVVPSFLFKNINEFYFMFINVVYDRGW